MGGFIYIGPVVGPIMSMEVGRKIVLSKVCILGGRVFDGDGQCLISATSWSGGTCDLESTNSFLSDR